MKKTDLNFATILLNKITVLNNMYHQDMIIDVVPSSDDIYSMNFYFKCNHSTYTDSISFFKDNDDFNQEQFFSELDKITTRANYIKTKQ